MEIFSHLLPKNSAIKLIGVLSYKYLLITVGAKRVTGSDEQLVSPRKTNAQKTLTILDPYKIFQIYTKRCQAISGPTGMGFALYHFEMRIIHGALPKTNF